MKISQRCFLFSKFLFLYCSVRASSVNHAVSDLFTFVVACVCLRACIFLLFPFSSCTRDYNTVTTAQLQRKRKEKFPKRKRETERCDGEEERKQLNIAQQKILNQTKDGKKGREKKRKSLTKIINYQGMFVRVSFSRLMDYFWFCLF